VALALTVVSQIVRITAVLGQRRALSNLVDGSGTLSEVSHADHVARVSAVLLVVGILLTAVFFIVWLWRMRRDADIFHPELQQRGRGWVIGGWFIPFANFVIPYLVIKDIVAALTTPPSRHEEHRRMPAIVKLWWGLWILSAIGDRVLLSNNPTDPSSFDTYTTIEIAGATLSIVTALLAIAVVGRLTQASAAQWERTSWPLSR
jgi:hypothetical protein